jgi:tetratricopeptide (TPR) repeat protein
MSTQDPKVAIATLEEALKIVPDQSSRELAETFLFAILQYYGVSISDIFEDRAIAQFTRALELRPNEPFPRMQREFVYCSLKQYSACLRDMNRAIEVASPEDKPRYFEARAHAYVKMKGSQKAIADYQTALQLYRQSGNVKGVESAQISLNILQGKVPLN